MRDKYTVTDPGTGCVVGLRREAGADHNTDRVTLYSHALAVGPRRDGGRPLWAWIHGVVWPRAMTPAGFIRSVQAAPGEAWEPWEPATAAAFHAGGLVMERRTGSRVKAWGWEQRPIAEVLDLCRAEGLDVREVRGFGRLSR